MRLVIRGSETHALAVVMSAQEALRRARYINVETFKRDGNGVKTPVWFVNVGDKLGVFTNGKSYKVKRLRRNSKVRVAACDARGGVGSAPTWYEGQGQIVDDPARIDAVYRALKAKYGVQMWFVTIGAKLSGRHKDWTVLELELQDPS